MSHKNKKPSIKSKTKIYFKNALDSPDLTPENKAVANKFQKHHQQLERRRILFVDAWKNNIFSC
jgi:hypothetical protein